MDLNIFKGKPKKKAAVDKDALQMRAFWTAEIAKKDGKTAARKYAKGRRKATGW